jgi:flagellar motor protein MotB
MKQLSNARWALSFADLSLVLLGFFVILQAHAADRARVVDSVRSAFRPVAGAGPIIYTSEALFQPGEAVFRRDAGRALGGIGRRAAARGQRVAVTSAGVDRLARRFDGWELAAARTAAVARAIGAGGLPEDRIEMAVMPAGAGRGQRIEIVAR